MQQMLRNRVTLLITAKLSGQAQRWLLVYAGNFEVVHNYGLFGFAD